MAISLFSIAKFFKGEEKLIQRGENALQSARLESFSFDPSIGVIKAKVNASMKKKTYEVELHLDESQALKNVSCTCPRGKHRCHHMAAVMIHSNKSVSCTDQVCQWVRKSGPVRIQTSEELFPPAKPFTALKRPVDESDRAFLYDGLKSQGRSCYMTWYLSPEVPFPSLPYSNIEDVINSKEFSENIGGDQIEFLLTKIVSTVQQIHEVEQLTRGQANNPLWGLFRRGRLTASNIGAVIKSVSSKRKPSTSLMKSLLGEYNLSGVHAVDWGTTHEKVAISQYELLTGFSSFQPGFILHESGIFGGSPDGIINEHKILEVKCPYAARSQTLQELISKGSFYLVKNEEDAIVLNLKDQVGFKYYHQIQANILVSSASNCDLFVWSPQDTVLITIYKDPQWSVHIEDVKKFYIKEYLPLYLKGGI